MSLSVRDRFLAFITEQFPFAADAAMTAYDRAAKKPATTSRAIDALRAPLARALRTAVAWPDGDAIETTPGVTIENRRARSLDDLVAAVDGFLVRESIAASFTDDERLEMLRGMILTRAIDTRLKTFFTGSEVRYGSTPFQGKGFRSLGQEAIYAAAIRLRRGAQWRAAEGTWQGDVIGPIIRDLGAALAMRNDPATVRMVLNAQMGKAGPPMDGRDLHVGDFDWGIVPATAPLSVSTLTVAGMALAFKLTNAPRVAVSFIGEGGSSLGEWHEAINMCAARQLPAIFCLENNQTALSTPVSEQSAVRVFADKAAGYGIPGLTIDGTDPEAIGAAFAWAADRARAGQGPALIELVAMRMCGHAHHDDMLYLGKDPQPSWDYPTLTPQGYANADLYEFWRARDPIVVYARALEARGSARGWGPRAAGGRSRRRRRSRGAGDHRRAVAGRRASDGRRHRSGPGVARASRPARPRRRHVGGGDAAADRPCAALRQEGHDVARSRDAGRRRRAGRRSKNVRLRRGRRRRVRQRVPAAASAAREVRRSHSELAARGGRRARRMHRRCAGRTAADWRDAVQRLRRDGLQPARQQRRQDSVPVGRIGAHGRADAVGWAATRRAVSLAEHRAVVLPHARAQDRRAVHALRGARAHGVGGGRSRSGAVLRAHRALSRSADQTGHRHGGPAGRCRSDARPSGARATI